MSTSTHKTTFLAVEERDGHPTLGGRRQFLDADRADRRGRVMATTDPRPWGPGTPAGESGAVGRGTAGEAAPTRTGTARPLIAWAALLLTVLCVVLAVITTRANGLLILATVFLVVWVWAIGAHRRSWWLADDATSRRLDDVDQDIAFIESVDADLAALTRKD